MTRTMYDSTNARDIPRDAQMVAGYVNGLYRWSQADWDRFPNAEHVSISITAAANIGDVLDVEMGDATPAQAPRWIRARQASGLHRPTIYCALSVKDQVQSACIGLAYDLWIAHYTGHPHTIPGLPGAAAVQYADPATSGGHYDLSAVYDDNWPHRSQPQPQPPPPHTQEEDMPNVYVPAPSAHSPHDPTTGQQYEFGVIPVLAGETVILGSDNFPVQGAHVRFVVGNDVQGFAFILPEQSGNDYVPPNAVPHYQAVHDGVAAVVNYGPNGVGMRVTPSKESR